MYAIVKTGGHQYKVAIGDHLNVEKLPVEAGEKVELEEVLMVSGDAHQPEHLQRTVPDLVLGSKFWLVLLDRLLEVLGDPHQRVQTRQRLLEDHAELHGPASSTPPWG